MRAVPQTKFTKPKPDTDETILDVEVKGDILPGGYIT